MKGKFENKMNTFFGFLLLCSLIISCFLIVTKGNFNKCINPITNEEFYDGCNQQDLCSLNLYSGSKCCNGNASLSESELEWFNEYHGGCENGTRSW